MVNNETTTKTSHKLLTGFSAICLAPLLALALARLFAHDAAMPLIWANMFTLYLYLPAYPIAAFAAFKRNKPLALAAAVVVVAHLSWIAPDFLPSDPKPTLPRSVRIFSANLLMINPDPSGIISELNASDPDVLLFQEYSPRWEAALQDADIPARYPHFVGIARPDSFGTAIYSKRPLDDARVIDVEGLPMTQATLRADTPLSLINVHTLPPRTAEYTKVFRTQMRALERFAKEHKNPLAMIGDFNVTQHAASYQSLREVGARAAHRERGRGYAVTFPNGIFPLPPVRLDHALMFGAVRCAAIEEGMGANSDHRPLLVELAW